MASGANCADWFQSAKEEAVFSNLLKQMLLGVLYVVYHGIADFCQQYSAIHRDVQGLRKMCWCSSNNSINHKSVLNGMLHKINKVLPSERTYNLRIQYQNLNRLLTKDVAATRALITLEKIACTLRGSHVTEDSYSSTSNRKKNSLESLRNMITSVSLCSEPTAELCNVVNIINGDPSIRSELDEILLEADKHKEGQLWDADSIESGDLKLLILLKISRKTVSFYTGHVDFKSDLIFSFFFTLGAGRRSNTRAIVCTSKSPFHQVSPLGSFSNYQRFMLQLKNMITALRSSRPRGT